MSQTPAPSALPPVDHTKDAAWILIGGSLTFITTGVVFAYATNSTETDIQDLYYQVSGAPATFDAKTQARYDELVKQGRLYEHLSWASFGVAGGMAIAAGVLFWRDAHRSREPVIAPVVTPTTAGVSVRF